MANKSDIERSEKEFEVYRTREVRQLENDFDRALKELTLREAGGDDE